MPRGLRVLQAPPYVTRLLSEAGVVKEMVAVLAGPGPAPARRVPRQSGGDRYGSGARSTLAPPRDARPSGGLWSPDVLCQTRSPSPRSQPLGADATEVRSDRLAKPGEVGATSNSGPRGDPYPRLRSQLAAPGFAWQTLPCEHPRLAHAFVRWNALECARGGHKSGHKLSRGRISRWATCWKQWWAGTGLNRRHQDFQSYSLGRGSARKCLLSKAAVTTASCAGVLRNDQECA